MCSRQRASAFPSPVTRTVFRIASQSAATASPSLRSGKTFLAHAAMGAPATHHGKPFAIWSRSKVSRSADEVRCAATSRAGDTPSSVSGSSASMRR